jgi:hypothetical protein
MRRARWIAQIGELKSLGLSRHRIADLLGIQYATVVILARAAGIQFEYDRTGALQPIIAASKDRATSMAALYREGYTLEEIGKQYGVTRERVRQLMTKHFGIRSQHGGMHRLVADRRRAAQAKRDAKYLRSHGCTFEQYCHVREMGRAMTAAGVHYERTPLGAFGRQRFNAKTRGIGWELTFWEWWTIWQQSGHWEQRGRGNGYVMCREGDSGPYAVGNVFIATAAKNSSDGQRKRRRDKSLPIGVSRTKSGRYLAQRSKKCLGTYDTPELAYAAYLRAGQPLREAA